MSDQVQPDTLQRFRIVVADNRVPEERRPWRREGIYLSPVCLAVHLSPTVNSWRGDDEGRRARDALYRYLRQVHQTSLEYGLVSPLACVISVEVSGGDFGEFGRSIGAWGSDQDWHRGSFTLYADPSSGDWSSEWRLNDLLQPKSEVLVARSVEEPRDGPWYAAELKNTLGARTGAGAAESTHALTLLDVLQECFGLKEDDPDYSKEIKKKLPLDDPKKGVLAAWKADVLRQARDFAAEQEERR